MNAKIKIIIILISFMITVRSYAANEVLAYFSYKLVDRGIMLGVEIFDPKTNKSLFNDLKGNYIYKWTIKEGMNNLAKSSETNSVFFRLDFPLRNFNLKVGIYSLTGRDEPIYVLDKQISLPEPSVRIVKISSGITLPFNGKLSKDEFLSFKFSNFYLIPDRVVWSFNEAFLSKDKEITAQDFSDKKGFIKLQIFSNLNEKAFDLRSIQVDNF